MMATISYGPMRAPGHPQASFAVESLVDELAYKIKMDPVEFRKKNLRDEVYHRQLDRGAKEIGWSRRNPVAGGNPGPLKRGMGCAVGTWGGGGNNQSSYYAPKGALKRGRQPMASMRAFETM